MHCRVPACGQGQVDDHVHRDEVCHGVVVGSHGAQDPLPSLQDRTTQDYNHQNNFHCGDAFLELDLEEV